jgi:UDP-N-acetylglucosamine 2-epimerase
MKIISIVGARPQFIKLAPLSREIRKYHQEIIIHTGQHFDKEMSETFFQDLGIAAPDYNLDINKGLHGEQTGRMLMALERILLDNRPGLIIVFGDTNTTLAGALAGSKLQIKTVHVEAGLRSFNRNMPEEINRVVADHTCDYLFAPTSTAVSNLMAENLSSKSYLTGDIMVDAHKTALELSTAVSLSMAENDFERDDYYLLTLHRPYNVDEPDNLSSILSELGTLSQKIIFPVHPRTRKIINENQLSIPQNIHPIMPVGYLDFVRLQANAAKIITDSGGIQKEAYILKKPCITLRSETEWVETVEAGWNLLINPSSEQGYSKKIDSFTPSAKYINIFGENVAAKMVEIINSILKKS